jgi:hypothetical protein
LAFFPLDAEAFLLSFFLAITNLIFLLILGWKSIRQLQ